MTAVAGPGRQRQSEARQWRTRPRLVAIATITVIAYLLAGYASGGPDGQAGNPGYFIKPGTDFAVEARLPAGTTVIPGSGYDGQFAFAIAQDPFLLDRETVSSLDAPAYRYRRILLPALGWLTSGGDPEVLQWTLPAINLLAVVLSTLLLAAFLGRRGRSPWLALVSGLSIGMVAGTLNDVSDPLAAALLLAGLVFWIDNRTGPALLALTAAVFARDLYALPLAGVAAIEVARWRWAAWQWLVPPAAFAAWMLFVSRYLHDAVERPVDSPSPVPIAGAVEKVATVLRDRILGTANWEIAFVILALAIWVFLALRSVPFLKRLKARAWPSRQQCLPAVGLLALWFVPFLTLPLWNTPLSYVRYLAPAAGLLLIVYATTDDRWALRLALILLGLSIVNPLFSFLPTRNGPVLAL